jgi:hypothetical protein
VADLSNTRENSGHFVDKLAGSKHRFCERNVANLLDASKGAGL